MGAEFHCSWIKSGTDGQYNWSGYGLPGVPLEELPDGMKERDWQGSLMCKGPAFEGVEGKLWSLAAAAGVKWLKEPGDGWMRFLMDRDTAVRLVDKCRELIRVAILVEDQAG